MKPITTSPYLNIETGGRLWKTEDCPNLKACIYCDAESECPVVCPDYVPYDEKDKTEGCRK